MESRDSIVVAGLPIAEAFFRALDPDVGIERLVEEGARVRPGTGLMRLIGRARAMLTAERSALNTVQLRSEERRVGKDWVSKFRSRLSRFHNKTNLKILNLNTFGNILII